VTGVHGQVGRGISDAEDVVVHRPRLVLAPPSLEEAKEATTELKDATNR
jgi:hypothetical protein